MTGAGGIRLADAADDDALTSASPPVLPRPDSGTSPRGGKKRTRVWASVLIAFVASAVAFGGAFLLPAVLAQVPSEPFESDSVVPLGGIEADGEQILATVSVSEGWMRMGTGPFLPRDRVRLVSPDAHFRVELRLVSGERGSIPSVSEDVDRRLRAAAWSRESLSSGNEVRYTTITNGGTAITVAVVERPAASPADPGPAGSGGGQLVLVAAVPADQAALYRTVTADLVSSARFRVLPATTASTFMQEGQ